MERCKTSELRLADTVKCFEGAWGTAIVTQIADGLVTLFRPYGTTADFSYSGGVIPYIGSETITYTTDCSREWEVLDRKKLS